jgi:exodeoxyribonuclease VIII
MASIMVDIETFSSETNAQVVQIGACRFTLAPPYEILDRFLVNIDPFDPDNLVRDKSEATMGWWREQSQAALDGLHTPERISLRNGVLALASFLTPHDKTIWANAPTFDLAILRNAYKQLGIIVPWHYRLERDCRTMWHLIPKPVRKEIEKEMEGLGEIEHNGLGDAVRQARGLQRILQWVRVNTW